METYRDIENAADLLARCGRRGARLRNSIMRLAVLEALETGESELEVRLAWFKTLAGYRLLDSTARLLLRRTACTARTILRGWNALDPAMQEAFRNGALLPSAALRLIKREEATA